MRWTEDDIKNAGLVEDGKGNLVRPRRAKVAPRVCPNGARPVPKLESDIRLRAKEKIAIEKGGEGKGEECDQFRVIVTSYRMHDIDPDNLSPKYALDLLVEFGVLPGDSSSIITGGVLKLVEKVKTKEEERTEIRIEKLCR